MSEEREPINITINVSDTVPISLSLEREKNLIRCNANSIKMEQTAAELRIEVAALTVAIDAYKATEKESNKRAARREQEIHTLLTKIADMTHTIKQLKNRTGG